MRIHWIGAAIIGAGLAGFPALPGAAQGLPATLNGGDPVAAEADRIATQDVGALLRQADQAARQGRLPLASELVERAETLTLTRSTLAGTEGVPVREGLAATLAEARAALGRRDVPTATALMAQASGMQARP